MNAALRQRAAALNLMADENRRLRLQFGFSCCDRVRRFVENPEVLLCLDGLQDQLTHFIHSTALEALADTARRLANQHPGSRSLDGCGHAAVSATYAIARALAGAPLEAADYAAYAAVYGEGGYGAVSDRQSFEAEFQWQVDCLERLARKAGSL